MISMRSERTWSILRRRAPVVELPEDEMQRLYDEFIMYAYAY